MICQKCGKPIDENDNFCQECGAPAIKEEKIENPAPKKRGRPKKVKVVEETISNEATSETPVVEEVPVVEETPVEAVEEVKPVENVEEVITVNEEVVSNENVEEVVCEEKPTKKFSVKKLIFGIIGGLGFALSLLMFIAALSVLFIDVYNTLHMAFAHANTLHIYDANGVLIVSQLYSPDRIINIVNLALRAFIYVSFILSIILNALGKVSKCKTKIFNKGIKLSINSIIIPIISLVSLAFISAMLFLLYGIAFDAISIKIG